MSLTKKILIIAGIPLIGLLGLVAMSHVNFNRINHTLEKTSSETLIPIIEKDVPKINSLNASIATLLNADRDAYQAYSAQLNSDGCIDKKLLAKLKIDNDENIAQVAERIEEASVNFSDEAKKLNVTFKESFNQWKKLSNKLIENSFTYADNKIGTEEHIAMAKISFEKMRDCIDRIQQVQEGILNGENQLSAEDKSAIQASYSTLLNADRDAYQALVATLSATETDSIETLNTEKEDYTANASQVNERTTIAATTFNDEMNVIYAELKEHYTTWVSISNKAIEQSAKKIVITNEQKSLFASNDKNFSTMRDAIDKLGESLGSDIANQVSYTNKNCQEASSTLTSIISGLKATSWISLVAGIAMAIIVALIAVMTTKGIIKSMTKIIASLTQGSEQVASAADQISSASQSLAEGATEQAAGLEESSSSLEEMSSMTVQNSENAQQASELANQAKGAAEQGNSSMDKMNSAILDIQNSSNETAKIIKVIDEIAFQTNLLALNAAVEAARAGEAGKGFAVVAEEVRNLAMRSAEAAKNTTKLIEESVNNSQNGVNISQEVTESLSEIKLSIAKTTDLVAEIAAASQEQAQGIDQVNTAISQMDKVTQSNAANAEESASASEELRTQTMTLNNTVLDLVGLVNGKKNKTTDKKGYSSGSGMSDEVFHSIAKPVKRDSCRIDMLEKHSAKNDAFEGFEI